MLSAFASAFRTPDLRKKLLFTLGIIALYRLGLGRCPPRASTTARSSRASTRSQDNSLYGLINLFSGGALLQLSIFALGIMPYITASIILQLLTVVIPRLEALKKEGQSGQAQDHAVHPLPHRRPGDPAVHRRSSRWRARPGQLFQGCNEPADPRRLDLHHPRR